MKEADREFIQSLLSEALELIYEDDAEVELILERLYDFVDNIP